MIVGGIPMLFGGTPAGDPYFANVSLLMHMDGANNGTTFTDVTGKAVTRFGNTVTKTDVQQFGTASAYFDGTGDYLELAASTAWGITGDFTLEASVYITSGTGYRPIFIYRENTPDFSGYEFCINDRDLYFQGNTGSPIYLLSTGSLIPLNTWTRVAATMQSGMARTFISGTQVGANAIGFTSVSAGTTLRVGYSQPNAGYMAGNLDELRITKNVARYTSSYTPDTSPFPDF